MIHKTSPKYSFEISDKGGNKLEIEINILL